MTAWPSIRTSGTPTRFGKSMKPRPQTDEPRRSSACCGIADSARRFENPERDADLVTARLLDDWRRQIRTAPPASCGCCGPVFYRDREAYLVGELMSRGRKLPVVLALRNEESGIRVDAVLTGKEDMRNILFISTRSTFHVHTDDYREVLSFLDTLAPERGHPAMCAVLGFTHPARVALNQRLQASAGNRRAVQPHAGARGHGHGGVRSAFLPLCVQSDSGFLVEDGLGRAEHGSWICTAGCMRSTGAA